MNKKIVFIFAIICISFFIIFYYIFLISGNNKVRNQNEFVDDIFDDYKNYEANIDVIIKSNKNENVYNIYQFVNKDTSRAVINSPENIKGLTIEFNNGNLRISNKSIQMEKIFENYNAVLNHSLFLNTFIDEYGKNESTVYEENGEIVVEIFLKNDNTYMKSKVLTIDKEKRLPKKILIKDNAQNVNTSIIYNDIKIK